jgi:hypothetical protein
MVVEALVLVVLVLLDAAVLAVELTVLLSAELAPVVLAPVPT